jgi:hypothetical protein
MPSYQAWHCPFFFRNLRPYSNITSLKLDTALLAFPIFLVSPGNYNTEVEEAHQTETDRANANSRKSWLKKLGKRLPALTQVQIHLTQSHAEAGIGGWHYAGIRTLWYKTLERWRGTEM